MVQKNKYDFIADVADYMMYRGITTKGYRLQKIYCAALDEWNNDPFNKIYHKDPIDWVIKKIMEEYNL